MKGIPITPSPSRLGINIVDVGIFFSFFSFFFSLQIMKKDLTLAYVLKY